MPTHAPRPVRISLDDAYLHADLRQPEIAAGLVIFAQGSGSVRLTAHNRYVAEELGRYGLATLLVDLLTSDEAAADEITADYRFDIPRLGQRVTGVVDWVVIQPELRHLPVGLFGASTGAAAALIAAADRPALIHAVVSRGGRPDLAGDALERVAAPTLLLIGDRDRDVAALNDQAAERLLAHLQVELIPGATHLFEEPGTLEHMAQRAAVWFRQFLPVRRLEGLQDPTTRAGTSWHHRQ